MRSYNVRSVDTYEIIHHVIFCRFPRKSVLRPSKFSEQAAWKVQESTFGKNTSDEPILLLIQVYPRVTRWVGQSK